jgi:hypothetical protein
MFFWRLASRSKADGTNTEGDEVCLLASIGGMTISVRPGAFDD